MFLRLSAALQALNASIDDGEEFPDAVHQIAQRFHVSSEALTRAYDTQ